MPSSTASSTVIPPADESLPTDQQPTDQPTVAVDAADPLFREVPSSQQDTPLVVAADVSTALPTQGDGDRSQVSHRGSFSKASSHRRLSMEWDELLDDGSGFVPDDFFNAIGEDVASEPSIPELDAVLQRVDLLLHHEEHLAHADMDRRPVDDPKPAALTPAATAAAVVADAPETGTAEDMATTDAVDRRSPDDAIPAVDVLLISAPAQVVVSRALSPVQKEKGSDDGDKSEGGVDTAREAASTRVEPALIVPDDHAPAATVGTSATAAASDYDAGGPFMDALYEMAAAAEAAANSAVASLRASAAASAAVSATGSATGSMQVSPRAGAASALRSAV